MTCIDEIHVELDQYPEEKLYNIPGFEPPLDLSSQNDFIEFYGFVSLWLDVTLKSQFYRVIWNEKHCDGGLGPAVGDLHTSSIEHSEASLPLSIPVLNKR